MVFLDWEKTFDKLYQNRIWGTLARFSVPDALINAITSLYSNATFAVQIEGTFSTPQKQKRGIRQGCPLSPFLFIVTLAAIMYDTSAELTREHGADTDWPFLINHLPYADDTALL